MPGHSGTYEGLEHFLKFKDFPGFLRTIGTLKLMTLFDT